MKKYLSIFPLLFLAFCSWSAPVIHKANSVIQISQDSLNVYVGKYELKRNDQSVYVTLSIEDGGLVALQSWDGLKKYLNHLNGDNFIVAGLGWSVQFIRDKDKKIIQMIVTGTDVWVKINN